MPDAYGAPTALELLDGAIDDAHPDVVEEYAQLYAGGSMLVRNDHPEIERIYPLAEWIKHSTRGGGKVFRRVIIVTEDWHEVKGP